MTTIAIVGVGKLAHTFIRGFLKAPGHEYYQLILVGKNPTHNAELTKQWNLPTKNLETALKHSNYVIIAVKPKDYPQVFHAINQCPSTIHQRCPVIISFMSGITIADMETQLPGVEKPKIVRAMPNTSMEINQGITAITPGKYVSETELHEITTVLSLTSRVFEIPESLHPPFTALAGSGPAYIYLIAEAMTDAAVAQGLPRELAAALSALTIKGAAGMLESHPDSASQLRAAVTSPAGTTTAAVQQLEANGLRSAFYQALAAATKKAGG